MAILTVTSESDSGDGSLRAELAAASNGDTIEFAQNIGTINISSTLDVNNSVTIEGGGTSLYSKVTIDGGGQVTDFTVAGANVAIDGLTIVNGHSVGGYSPYNFSPPQSTAGGIYESGYGVLTVSNCIISMNSSIGGQGENGQDYFPYASAPGKTGGSAAGGIYVDTYSTLKLSGENSFFDNSATGGTGGTGSDSPPFHDSFFYLPPQPGGAGGLGGVAISPGSGTGDGNGGSPGLPGSPGSVPVKTPFTTSSGPVYAGGSGAGGNGGTAYADYGGNGTIEVVPVCFVTGTLIRTVRGNVGIQALQVGELVVTSSGTARPIRWIGHRTLDCRRKADAARFMPVRIAAHAFGSGRPARDLVFSPGHGICLDVLGEVLIPAASLIDGITIIQLDVERVTYWHVELDSHDILLAENQPAESYREMGNRGFFAETTETAALEAGPDACFTTHADFCRTFVDRGPLVEAVRSRIHKRATILQKAKTAA